MSSELIQLKQLAKKYNNRYILQDVDLTIRSGQAIAFIGRNGTGKSTLLKMISGLVNYSSGEIIRKPELKFHYIPENFPRLNFTAEEYLEHIRRIENISIKEFKAKSQQYYNAFRLEGMIDIPMKNLSKGSLQKVVVIQAILKKADILLLDEPLSGQDIQSQQYFIRTMNELKKQGMAILMSCHEAFLVKQIADIVYEVKDKHLHEIQLESLPGDYVVLVFIDSGQVISEQVEQQVERINKQNGLIEVLLKRERSNQIILQFLQQGFTLMSMGGISE